MIRREAGAGDRFAAATEGDEVMVKGGHPAVAIDRGPEVMPAGRPIEIMPHVVLTRPLQLHGPANLACDPRRLDHEVVAQPPAEAAADPDQVDVNAVLVDAQGTCYQAAAAPRVLCGRPHLQFARGQEERRAILGLHVRVRDERVVVACLDDRVGAVQYGFDVAVGPQRVAGFPAQGFRLLRVAARGIGVLRVPVHLQPLAR